VAAAEDTTNSREALPRTFYGGLISFPERGGGGGSGGGSGGYRGRGGERRGVPLERVGAVVTGARR